MANTLITPTIIANEMMLQVENNLVMANLVNRDYEDEFQKVGDTIQIRRPVKFTFRSGAVATAQDVEEGNISLQIANQGGVDFSFSSKDRMLTIDKFSERYIKPAAITIANQIDASVMALYTTVGNWVGTPGTTFAGFSSFGRGGQRLDENAVPTGGRAMVLSPADHWGMLGSLTGLYIDGVNKTALEKARLPMLAGMDAYMSQNVPSFTTGARGGTPLIVGASQNVTYAASKAAWTQTLAVDGATASVAAWANAGDVFTIAGVFDVNPANRAVSTRLKQFTVTAVAASNGSGVLSLTISPPIITSGPQQTCSAAPADNAALTFVGTAATAYPMNMAFDKNAFALVVRPMEIADGAPPGGKVVKSENFAIRMQPIYDGTNDVSLYRFDVLWGVKSVYPELAVRVSG